MKIVIIIFNIIFNIIVIENSNEKEILFRFVPFFELVWNVSGIPGETERN
jgi:hypothetical protein